MLPSGITGTGTRGRSSRKKTKRALRAQCIHTNTSGSCEQSLAGCAAAPHGTQSRKRGIAPPPDSFVIRKDESGQKYATGTSNQSTKTHKDASQRNKIYVGAPEQPSVSLGFFGRNTSCCCCLIHQQPFISIQREKTTATICGELMMSR